MFSIGQVHGTAVGTILFNTPWATLLLKVSPLKKDFFAGYAQHPPSVYKALLFSAHHFTNFFAYSGCFDCENAIRASLKLEVLTAVPSGPLNAL